jgi:hypothetical protein
LNLQDFTHIASRIHIIQKGLLIRQSISLALLLLLVGGGGVGVLLPVSTVSAQLSNFENNEDFDHTQDTDNGDRKVITTGPGVATGNTLPTTH